MSRIIIILILFIPCAALAGVSVDLSMDRYEISLTDSARLTVSVSGTRSSEDPKIKGFDNFSVQSGGTSSQVQIINGKFNSSVQYTYFLQPRAVGNFQIGPAEVEVDGRIYSSRSVNLVVKKSSPAERGAGGGAVFLAASLSSNKVYAEEQVIYTLRLYFNTNISNISLTSMPEDPNLTIAQMGKDVRYRTRYNNMDYNVIELRFSVIPSKPGAYNLFPAKMSMNVPEGRSRGGRGPFDDFFDFSPGRRATVASDQIPLEAIAPPEAGKPADFTGLVGDFTLITRLEPSSIKTGESATLTAVVKGKGSVKRIPDIKITDIKNLKIYGDEPVLETGQTAQGVEGIKTMKWAIVPESEGVYKIPPVSLSYFNTKTHRYSNLQGNTETLTVLPGTLGKESQLTADGISLSRSERRQVEEIGKDILPIHGSLSDLDSSGVSIPGWLAVILSVFPAAAYFTFRVRFRVLMKTPEKLSGEKAGRAARNLIKSIKGDDISVVMTSEALKDYFNNRFNMNLGILTSADAKKILLEKGCQAGTADETVSLLSSLENAIYTGQCDNAFREWDYLSKLVGRIEKEIR